MKTIIDSKLLAVLSAESFLKSGHIVEALDLLAHARDGLLKEVDKQALDLFKRRHKLDVPRPNKMAMFYLKMLIFIQKNESKLDQDEVAMFKQLVGRFYAGHFTSQEEANATLHQTDQLLVKPLQG